MNYACFNLPVESPGLLIRKAREETGQSQATLAAKAQVSPTTIQNLENPESAVKRQRPAPRLNSMLKVARALDLTEAAARDEWHRIKKMFPADDAVAEADDELLQMLSELASLPRGRQLPMIADLPDEDVDRLGKLFVGEAVARNEKKPLLGKIKPAVPPTVKKRTGRAG